MNQHVYTDPSVRHDALFFIETVHGTLNGDPDNHAAQRVDFETGHAIATDVSLKRKIRDTAEVIAQEEGYGPGYRLFMKSDALLNAKIREAYQQQGLPTSEEVSKTVPKKLLGQLQAVPELLEGFVLDGDALVYNGSHSAAEMSDALADVPEDVKSFVLGVASAAKPVKNSPENVNVARNEMCRRFFDVRTFGAVMTTGVNAGQVRGAVQVTFAETVDPVQEARYTITRKAITAEKDEGKAGTMGSKSNIPFGLFRGNLFYNPFLGRDTGISRKDLELFWRSFELMFELNRSATQGTSSLRKVFIFSHDTKLGNAHAHKLFDLVKVKRLAETPRSYSDYEISVGDVPEGITLTTLA